VRYAARVWCRLGWGLVALLAASLASAPALATSPADDREIASGVSSAELAHARSLILRGRFAAAADVLRALVRVEPSLGAAWRGLGLAEELMRHRPEAIRAYRRYLELHPDAPDAALVQTRIDRVVRELGWDPG
jgi:Flp pilus assembly protein TadD